MRTADAEDDMARPRPVRRAEATLFNEPGT